jgi:ABC-type amino acid transport substrate-binding protein
MAALALPQAAAAQTLEQVRETGLFTIGYRQDAAPFSLGREDGSAGGYSVDLCTAIADAVRQDLGLDDLQVEYRAVTVENRFDALTGGEIDILCGATTATLERRELVDFTLLTFVTGAAVLVPQDSDIDSLADTAGGRVGVLGDTTTEQGLREALEGGNIDTEVVTFETRSDGLEAMMAGEIEAFFGDRILLLGLAMALENPMEVRVSSNYLTIEPYALAVRRGDSDLRLVADRTLAGLYRSGEIGAIFQRWFVGGQPSELLQSLFVLQALPE